MHAENARKPEFFGVWKWKASLKWVNPLNTNPTKFSGTQRIRRPLPTNCLSVFDHFMGLALKRLMFL